MRYIVALMLVMSSTAFAGTCTDLAIKSVTTGLTTQEHTVWKNQCKAMTATDYRK